jgi:rubrerythrin
MFDGEKDPESESTYSCLKCGKTLTSTTHPVECPNCGSVVQNRANSLE